MRNGGIYVMDPDGSNQTRLINNFGVGEPRLSPDGTKIASSSNPQGFAAGGTDNGFEIYVTDFNGSNPTRLTEDLTPTLGSPLMGLARFVDDDVDPAWSPDGTKIAFASQRDWDYEIYVMDADGSNPTRLTENNGWDRQPDWSPDGSKIAFSARHGVLRDGGDFFEIYVMDADGSNQTQLTSNVGDDKSPSWSPDGSKIAFVSDRYGSNGIHVMDADGSNQTRLTDSAGNRPCWSPDGSKIAFTSDRDGHDEIYVMDADGSNQTRLTNNVGDDKSPSWSPDWGYWGPAVP
ncbi:DUF5050 domain-containing protein [SAR202 cluster bacterium AD-812-D07_MRT_10900m]|nr:DUF5050 domain-containing protein [SAR202 cluster bacterium AD-812-D07_MRT_10900m]